MMWKTIQMYVDIPDDPYIFTESCKYGSVIFKPAITFRHTTPVHDCRWILKREEHDFHPALTILYLSFALVI